MVLGEYQNHLNHKIRIERNLDKNFTYQQRIFAALKFTLWSLLVAERLVY